MSLNLGKYVELPTVETEVGIGEGVFKMILIVVIFIIVIMLAYKLINK